MAGLAGRAASAAAHARIRTMPVVCLHDRVMRRVGTAGWFARHPSSALTLLSARSPPTLPHSALLDRASHGPLHRHAGIGILCLLFTRSALSTLTFDRPDR